jgi:hypothetical protein
MRDYISIGPAPADEQCAQLGADDYYELVMEQCRRFREVIRKHIGPEPKGAELKIKSFPHDFGTYYEVVCYYDDAYPDAVDYAFRCEAESPLTWEG